MDKTRPTKAFASSARLAKAPRRVGGSTGVFGKVWAQALALALMMHVGVAAAGTPPGTVISNTGSLTFTVSGGGNVVQQSNTVNTTVVSAAQTPSSVIFMAYAPGSSAASSLLAGPTLCSTDGGVTFNPLANPVIGGSSFNPANPLSLAPTTMYNQGDVLFIQLTDLDQNVNPAVRDTVMVSVSVPSLHETVTLKLTETGPNTGVFVGYVPTSSAAASGCSLQTGANTLVQVNYTDPQDSSDQSAATALVDPYSVVFDSSSGQRLNGVKLTLVDATTGKPVQVLGKDGVSSYPSTVTSGTAVTDSSGAPYSVPAGGFLFPQVKSGNYRLQVVTPTGYHAPSVVGVSQLETLPGAPYTLPAASFGGQLGMAKQGIVQFDVPLDPVATALFLQKTASQPQAAVGDFMQFSLLLQNPNNNLAAEGVSVVDVLPQGFRYVKGSSKLGSAALADPTISANGQQLTFSVGTLAATTSVTITYAVEITAAAPLATVVNSAQAFEGSTAASNVGTAEVQVQSDFLQNVNTLIGRVVVGCDVQGGKGVEKARIVMEDGSYAITDKNGDYHFQAITSGTHVAQLDLPSLPKGYEPMSCEKNTRWAGRDYSQFVEVHGGALWRADFHVRPIPGAEGDLGLQLSQEPAADHVHNTVNLVVSSVPVTKLSSTVMLAEGMSYVAGSARLDGKKIDDPQDLGDGMLVFRLGDREAGWKGVLEFDSMLPAVQTATPAEPAHLKKSFTIEAFPSGRTEMSAHDLEVMQQIAGLIKGSSNIIMTFVGYTDDVQLAPGSQYANNMELSIARAQAVADYLQAHIDVDGAQIFISGRGSNEPVASNSTEEGRAKNRRTQIDVEYDPKTTVSAAPAVTNTVFQTRALANFDSPSAKSQHTPAAAVVLHALPGHQSKEQQFTLQDFASGSTSLSTEDQETVQQLATLLKGASNVSLTFVGYTDDQQLVAGSKYANNMELSIARAQAAADYVRSHVDIDGAQVFIVGRGSNDTVGDGSVDARDKNRRTTIKVEYDEAAPATASVGGQSEVQHAAVKGLSPADDPDNQQQNAADVADDKAPDQDKLADKFEVDTKWLQNQADGTPQFIWPVEDFLPAVPSIHVAVEHGFKQKAALFVNGEQVDSRNSLGATRNARQTAAVSQWIGVPLQDGDNTLVAVVTDGDTVVKRLERKVHYSGTPVRAEFVADKSSLVADGRSKPVFAVRFFDRWGYPARRGLVGHYQLSAPFQSYESVQQLQQDQVSAVGSTAPQFVIGKGGIAYLKFAPTTSTGTVTVTVPLQNGTYEELHGWVHPAGRDWILVGVANGTAAFNKIKNNMQTLQGDDPNSDIYQDGRVAFYAKGTISGDYLLTASYDSAKAGGVGANGLQQAVNPNTYFMLYGDASQQGFDASSASKLYIKIERGQFYAMFGDFMTGLTVTELSRYDRLFNGVKSAYQGDNFGYNAFAAQNTQAYVKDEIQGNGTSGLYHLSHQQLLINSDRLSIETRDRYTNAVISTQQLTQFVDYTIDYFSGTIFFKEPIAARDGNFNPVYIVAEYEVTTGAGNAITAGGRASMKFNDGKVEVGATAVNEGTGDGNNRLTGTDLKVQVTPATVLKAEVAHTSNGPNGSTGSVSNVNGVSLSSGASTTSNSSGNAYSVDLKTESPTLQNDFYVKNEDATFGLGQQNLGDQGMRRLGDDARYHLDQNWNLTGDVLREQSLVQDVTNDVASAGLQYKFDSGDTLSAGLQHSSTSFATPTPTLLGGTAQGDYSSNQLTVGGSYGLLNRSLILHGNVQSSIGGSANDPQYPNLADFGADYKLTQKTTLFADEQIANGGQQSDHTLEVGLKTEPWSHADVNTSVSEQSTEYGPRLFSTLGLTQGWEVTKNFSMQVGYNRVASMHEPNFPATATPVAANIGGGTTPSAGTAAAPAVGSYTSDFNSLFVGGSYALDTWGVNGRVEQLNSSTENNRNLFAGAYHMLNEGEAFSASLQLFHSVFNQGGTSDNATGRFGYTFRPDDSRWSWLEQLDLVYADQQSLQGLPQFASPTGTAASQESGASLANNLQTVSSYGLDMRTWKAVNNLQTNYTVTERYQLSLYYGSKFARYAFDTGNYKDYTDLMGAEFRYDLSEKNDIGLVASRLHSWGSNTYNNQIGIEAGWDVGTNMWLSVGYNFTGFYDQDFTASHYTAQGVFIRFRFKFDQDTVKDMASAGKLVLH